MDLLLSALRLLTKAQPTLTFPNLGLADDRRETPIVDSQSQVDLRNKLSDKAALTHYGAKTAVELSARHNLRLAPHHDLKGMASGHGRASYAATPELLDQQGLRLREGTHPNSAQGTKLHEDLHQMFTRVSERYGAGGRKRLAADLVASLPEDERTAAQDFSVWKGYKADNHEETLANLISYHNQPGERRDYRIKRFQYFGPGNQPARAAEHNPEAPEWDLPRRRALTAGYTHPKPPRHEREEGLAALAHDQAMKRALRRLRVAAANIKPLSPGRY